MKSTLYTRSVTPEQRNLSRNKDISLKSDIHKPLQLKEKKQIAFLNKEIFSNPQRLAAFNLKPTKNEKTSKNITTATSKNIRPAIKNSRLLQHNPQQNVKSPPKFDTKNFQEQNNLFKYLLNNTPQRAIESSSYDSPEKDEKFQQKTEPKRTKFIDSIQDSKQNSDKKSGEKNYELLLEQMKEEKRAFYEKLNNINNKGQENSLQKVNNYQITINDSVISNSASFFKNKLPENTVETLPNHILGSSEIEKATLIKLLEELNKNKRKKEEELRDLKEKLEKQEEELTFMRKNHSEIKSNLLISVDELKNENFALETQVEKATLNLKNQEASCQETQNLIANYKQEINQLNHSLKKKEIDYEKELSRLELNISKENNRQMDLIKKFEDLTTVMKTNTSLKEQYNLLNNELNIRKEEITQLESKKTQLISKQNDIRIHSQEMVYKLKEEINRKTQELHKMKNEFNEFCKSKEHEKQELENEIIGIESDLKKLQMIKEQENNESQDRLHKIMKENENLENELKKSEAENESKMKDIQDELESIDHKSKKLEEEIQDLDSLKRNLKEEYDNSKKIFEDEIKKVEKENYTLEAENEDLEKNIKLLNEGNIDLENELNERKAKQEDSFDQQIEKLNKELEDYKYSLENLTKSKEDLEKEIDDLNKRTNEENKKRNEYISKEKDKIKIMAKLKNELKDLQRINEDNNNLLKKMLEEKTQHEKELADLSMLSGVYQQEMERNLETINIMTQKESQLNNKIKTMEAELKSKKKK